MSLSIVDFHSHHVAPSWTLTTALSSSGPNRLRWEKINRDLQDRAALFADVDDGDIAARVVNSPTAFIEEGAGGFPVDAPKRINEQLAELVAARPEATFGLATVDTFGGERAARDLETAVRQFGLHGVFLESARGERLIDAPEARPVLEAAAELGVPVFLHPVNPAFLTEQLEPYGRYGTLLARGTVNAAALASLIAGGVFDALPALRVVVANLAIAGILIGATFDEADDRSAAATALRRQVYADTMGFNPVVIRALVDTLGVEHVLAGSDWPIVSTGPIAPRLTKALIDAGLDEDERRLVAGANARCLLSRA